MIYELSAWGGLNLRDDSSKINPGEFVTLTNASTVEGLIKVDAVDALINMPVAKNIYKNLNSLNYENPWPYLANAGGIITAVCLQDTAPSLASGDAVGIMIPFTMLSSWAGGAIPASGLFGINDFYVFKAHSAASGIPGAGIGYNYFAAGLGFISAATGLTARRSFYSSREVLVTQSASAGSGASGWWVGIAGDRTSGTGPSSFTIVATAVASTSGNSASWSTISAQNFSCIIYKHSLSGGHVLSIIPINIAVEDKKFGVSGISTGNNAYSISGYVVSATNDKNSFSRIYNSEEPTYKAGFMANAAGASGVATSNGAFPINRFIGVTGSGTIYQHSDFNVVEVNDGIVSFSCPESQNGIGFDYDDDQLIDSYQELTYQAYSKYRRKKSGCFYNGYYVPARNGACVAIELNRSMNVSSTITKDYGLKLITLNTTFNNPRGVVSYNNYLIFYNVINSDGTRLSHRMYFNQAGIVDSFSSSQYENLSDGEEILWMEEWYGSLIVFFPTKVKRYTGTPGNASLETIFYKGVYNAESVCKTSKGIMFLSNDGLYIYNGTISPLEDLSKKFLEADSRSVSEDGWMEFNEKTGDLYFYSGYSNLVNVWNSNKNTFRQKDYTSAVCSAGMRFFKYYDNKDLKFAVSYPSIAHVSEMEKGTTYRAATAKSGWIDVNGQYENKRFDRAILEFKGTDSGTNIGTLLNDNFTDTAGTPIQNHTPDTNNTGDSWHDDQYNVGLGITTGWTINTSTHFPSGNAVLARLINPKDNSKYFYINANKSEYTLTANLYLDGSDITDNILFRGKRNETNDGFGEYLRLEIFQQTGTGTWIIYDDANNVIDSQSFLESGPGFVDIKIVLTTSTIKVYSNNVLVNNVVNSKYGDDGHTHLGFSSTDGSALRFGLNTLNITYLISDTFNFICNFDDGASVSATIPTSGTGIVSYPVRLDRQSRLFNYEIETSAQNTQTAITRLKMIYDPTMEK
jgi:hypothetical protein